MEQGLIFDLSNLNPGTWFDMEGGGKICLRVCAGEDYRNIRNQTHRKKTDWKPGNNPRIKDVHVVYEEEIDPTGSQFNELLWDFCIVSWENLFDANKTPIPCTKEMKVLLMNKSIKFSKFVTDALGKLTEIDTGEMEAESKN